MGAGLSSFSLPTPQDITLVQGLAETVLMGNLAVRYPNRRLLWSGEKMEVTNDKDANAYVQRKYRDGWAL